MSNPNRWSRLRRQLASLAGGLPSEEIQQVVLQEAAEGEPSSQSLHRRFGITTLTIRHAPGELPQLPKMDSGHPYKIIVGIDPLELV